MGGRLGANQADDFIGWIATSTGKGVVFVREVLLRRSELRVVLVYRDVLAPTRVQRERSAMQPHQIRPLRRPSARVQSPVHVSLQTADEVYEVVRRHFPSALHRSMLRESAINMAHQPTSSERTRS